MEIKFNTNKAINFLLILALLVSLFTTLMVTKEWTRSFHNIDLCHNELGLEKDVNLILNQYGIDYKLEEIATNGKRWDLVDCYVNGYEGIYQSFYNFGMSSFLLGLMIGIFVMWRNRK